MNWWVLSTREFHARLTDYMLQVGLPWDASDEAAWQAELAEECASLAAVLGEAQGRSVLDCACGWGRQAVALAKTGWQVTATDVSEANMDVAKHRARQEGVDIDFLICDMRELGRHFQATFDWAVCGFALYDIDTDQSIQEALSGISAALKPAGRCYLQQRDMDNLIREKPRHEFHGERRVPHGRVICVEDFDYVSETHVIHMYAFLREDERYSDWRRWHTDVLGYRKRAIRKAELEQFLRAAGFRQIEFLPQASPWHPIEVVASK
jgi:ubiquinone/menaquinone biosynthesis C-methylase UbiE